MARSNYNPRRKNGTLRNKHRARLKALGLPCAICGGVIDYEAPSDFDHPLSFVVDERLPVSRWKQWGYPSPEAAAQDWNNLQPAHYICNLRKRDKTLNELKNRPPVTIDEKKQKMLAWSSDGMW